MKKRFYVSLILVLVLAFVSTACNLGKKTSKLLGDEYRSEVGGFSLNKVNDYSFDDSFGIVNMTAPEASPETGPGIMVMGGLMEEEMSNEDLLESMKAQASTIEVGKPKKTKVDGVAGLLADLSGEYQDVTIKGKIFMAMVSPKQEFILMGLAPKDEWKKVEPIFEAVLDSVTLFEASTWVMSDDSNDDIFTTVSSEPQVIRQWASYATAGSEYSSTEWSAEQATGDPDVDSCGDNPNAWASAYSSGEDWIELTYDIPVSPTEINIIQSYSPSQVVEVDIVDLNGDTWVAWSGEPVEVDSCPDQMTISIELEEPLYINRVVVFIDQDVLDTDYVEIDAVELVGYPEGEMFVASSDEPEEEADEPAASVEVEMDEDLPIPTNYSGWMAESVYQGWVKVIVNETKEKNLDKIMTIKGTKSTENWKPRPDHKDTYIYEMGPDGMKAYISVTTDGIVYKKSISSNVYPPGYALDTVNQANYDILNADYKDDYVIHYASMANLLESPGFLRESYYRPEDDTLVEIYEWLAPNGDRLAGSFYNRKLTGMAGLAYIPKQ